MAFGLVPRFCIGGRMDSEEATIPITLNLPANQLRLLIRFFYHTPLDQLGEMDPLMYDLLKEAVGQSPETKKRFLALCPDMDSYL